MTRRVTTRVELLQGTLDMLVLRALLLGPLHGHAIATHIKRTSEEVLYVDHGSLYPAIHRLKKRGWITASWQPMPDRKPGGQVLPADGCRQEAACQRAFEMAATRARDWT